MSDLVLLTFEPLLAVLVVDLPLLLVGEDLVGLGDLLELLLGARALVLVRVELERHFAVRLLDVVLAARAGRQALRKGEGFQGTGRWESGMK